MAKPNNNRWSNVEMRSTHITQLMRKINELESVVLIVLSSLTYDSKWGTAGTGDGQFSILGASPFGVIAHNDEIYVSDRGSNDRIQVFDANGVFVRKWGSSGTGTTQMNDPSGMWIYENEIYVAEPQNSRIHVFDLNGVHRTMWGSLGSGDGEFNAPSDVFVYNDEVYVVDHNNARIQVFDTDGVFVRKWGGSGAGVLSDPTGIHVDTNGEVFVCEDVNHRIVVFDTSGDYIREFGTSGTGDGELDNPTSVRISGTGAYVVDSDNNRVQVFNKTTGVFVSKIGAYGTGNGQFNVPTMCAVYANKLYVCDGANHRVQVFQLTADEQTGFYHTAKSGAKFSLGTPDTGVNVPALDAMRMKVPTSELTDTTIIELADTYLLQIRAALKTLVDAATILNPKTGAAYNLNAGDTTNNVYYVAMNPHMADYGLTGETLYTWARPLKENETEYYDVDIGEVWRVTEVLYDAARIQGLL